MLHFHAEEAAELMEWDCSVCEGRRTVEIEVRRSGWRLFRDGCPGGEDVDKQTLGGTTPFFDRREIHHDLTEPVSHTWNGRVTAAASAR